jgi:fused signal recognition particle receptor
VVVVVVVLYVVFGRGKSVELPGDDEPSLLPDAAEPPAAKSKSEAPTRDAAKPSTPNKPSRDEAERDATKEQPKAREPKPSASNEAAPKAAPAKVSDVAKAAPTTVDIVAAAEELSGDDIEQIPSLVPPQVAPAAAPEPKAPSGPSKPARPKDVAGLRRGLAKTRESEGFFGRLKSLFAGRKEIDPGLLDQLEEVLLTSDVGMKTTSQMLDAVKEQLTRGELKDEARVWSALRDKATDLLDIGGGPLKLGAKPTVVMVVGVNGVGKTTTIGKLAARYTAQGKKVVLAAGDTFRAAAVQQLAVWGKRTGCEVVTGDDGANPGAVIFDAIQRAKSIGADLVLADTAGRLHTKSNLMEELKKISRTMAKALDGAPHETILVVDGTTGQNASQQAALFKEALPLSGLVLTKLDGTAKGGIVLGICAEHAIPVRYIGIGEKADELRDFAADEFVEALLGNGSDDA